MCSLFQQSKLLVQLLFPSFGARLFFLLPAAEVNERYEAAERDELCSNFPVASSSASFSVASLVSFFLFPNCRYRQNAASLTAKRPRSHSLYACKVRWGLPPCSWAQEPKRKRRHVTVGRRGNNRPTSPNRSFFSARSLASFQLLALLSFLTLCTRTPPSSSRMFTPRRSAMAACCASGKLAWRRAQGGGELNRNKIESGKKRSSLSFFSFSSSRPWPFFRFSLREETK